MGVYFERAQLLFEQSRFEQAEQEVRRELADDPANPMAHALLGLCLAQTRPDDPEAALGPVRRAIEVAPDLAFAYYALADVLHDQRQRARARVAVEEAIRLDPDMPNYFALLAAVELEEGRWDEALAAADRGLALDPGHVECGNLRALALVKLVRPREAADAFAAALARDPDNAVTHANLGWALLHQGQAARALHHFREALRLDADFDSAREGVLEAFKARFVVYQVLVRVILWLAGRSRLSQWVLIVGGCVAYLGLRAVAEYYGPLRAYIMPLLGVYLLFGILVWIADPLFNLLLRLDRLGRRALSRDQVRASNGVGASLALALVLAAAGLLAGKRVLLLASGTSALMTLPLARVYDCAPGRPRRRMVEYTAAVAACGVGGLVVWGSTGGHHGVTLLLLFLLGAFFSGFVSLALIASKPKC